MGTTMAGMADASNPTAGMPIIPAQVAPQVRSNGQALGSPAIQLPAVGPIGPTATAQAIGAAVARPDLPVAPSVAGGGLNGPTLTPQGLVAAKQASADSLGVGNLNHLVLGDSGVAAQQAMRTDAAQGNYAGAVGDFARGTGIGVARLAAAPFVGAADIGANVYDAAAGGVTRFARGLFGMGPPPATAPAVPAAPVVAAVPAVQPSLAGGMPVVGAAPGVVSRPYPVGTAPVAATAPAALTTAVAPGAGMPVAAPPFADLEKAHGLAPGLLGQTIAMAHPSQRASLISSLIGTQQTSGVEAAKASVRDSIVQSYNQDMAKASKLSGTEADTAIANALARYKKDMTTATNPAGASAAVGLQSFMPDGT